MSELIRREDCDLYAPTMGTDEMLWSEVANFHLTARERVYEDDLYEFARAILQKAQNVIDTAPTVTTDEVLAYKCPECRVVSILYDPENEHHCPNCGISRRKYM